MTKKTDLLRTVTLSLLDLRVLTVFHERKSIGPASLMRLVPGKERQDLIDTLERLEKLGVIKKADAYTYRLAEATEKHLNEVACILQTPVETVGNHLT